MNFLNFLFYFPNREKVKTKNFSSFLQLFLFSFLLFINNFKKKLELLFFLVLICLVSVGKLLDIHAPVLCFVHSSQQKPASRAFAEAIISEIKKLLI